MEDANRTAVVASQAVDAAAAAASAAISLAAGGSEPVDVAAHGAEEGAEERAVAFPPSEASREAAAEEGATNGTAGEASRAPASGEVGGAAATGAGNGELEEHRASDLGGSLPAGEQLPSSWRSPSDSMPSIAKSPAFGSLKQSSGGCCMTCGRGAEGRRLHRLKHDGAVRLHCSCCILFYNKGMYCSQCFRVYRDASQLGDPAMWLTCGKCQRLSHLDCVRNLASPANSLDFSSFTCHDCCNPSSSRKDSRGSHLPDNRGKGLSSGDAPPLSQDRSTVSDLTSAQPGDVENREPALENSSALDEEAVAAANIVAALAANEAQDARARARGMAAAAVKAAARAKAALDAAYRSVREEARWRLEVAKSLPSAAGPSTTQFTGAMLSNVVGKRKFEKLETSGGGDDRSGQSARIPLTEEESPRQVSNVSGASTTPRTSLPSHKRRALSSLAASESTQAPSSLHGTSQQDATAFEHQHQNHQLQQPQTLETGTSIQAGQHEASTSVHEIADQILKDLDHSLQAGPFVGSEGLAVSASPASILEGDILLGTPRSSSSTTLVGIHEANAIGNGCCSTFLPEKDALGTSGEPALENGLGVLHGEDSILDGSHLPLSSITAISVADRHGVVGKTVQPNSKEMETFSHYTSEAMIDDLVDLGALVPRDSEKGVQLSNGFIGVEGDSTFDGISVEGASTCEKMRETTVGNGTMSKANRDDGLKEASHQLSPSSKE